MGSTGFRVHPTAEVSDKASVGTGSSIWNHSQVRENVTIGEGCILGKDVYIDFDVQIGDNVKIQNGCFVYHGTTVESGVFIGPGVIFTNDKRPRAINPDGSLKTDDDWEVGNTVVQYGASIGAGSIVITNITIGKFAMVGAGSIVTKDVPQNGLVIGNPARLVGYVCDCGNRLNQFNEGQYRCPDCGREYKF
jgi:acetyltransferase-like isoleucine patch superfamily enzyme